VNRCMEPEGIRLALSSHLVPSFIGQRMPRPLPGMCLHDLPLPRIFSLVPSVLGGLPACLFFVAHCRGSRVHSSPFRTSNGTCVLLPLHSMFLWSRLFQAAQRATVSSGFSLLWFFLGFLVLVLHLLLGVLGVEFAFCTSSCDFHLQPLPPRGFSSGHVFGELVPRQSRQVLKRPQVFEMGAPAPSTHGGAVQERRHALRDLPFREFDPSFDVLTRSTRLGGRRRRQIHARHLAVRLQEPPQLGWRELRRHAAHVHDPRTRGRRRGTFLRLLLPFPTRAIRFSRGREWRHGGGHHVGTEVWCRWHPPATLDTRIPTMGWTPGRSWEVQEEVERSETIHVQEANHGRTARTRVPPKKGSHKDAGWNVRRGILPRRSLHPAQGETPLDIALPCHGEVETRAWTSLPQTTARPTTIHA